MATPALGFDNFYTSTLSAGITASDTTIYLNALPTATEGYIVIEPDSATAREIIYYTSKGANFVTLPSSAAGRGVGATTAVSHSSGVTCQMNVVAEHFEALQDGTGIADNAITTAKVANNAITAAKLSTSAIKLGYAERTSDFTTTAVSTWTDVTSLSIAVTIPAGGRDIKITAFVGGLKTSAAAGTFLACAIMEGTTVLGMGGMNEPVSAYNIPFTIVARVSAPSTGSHTYKVAVASSAAGTTTAAAGPSGTASATNAFTAAFILVEAI